ncbi:MAG: septum formation family protein [Gulosibacter sp.]|uniref:septum formation family protein n=1 Tax=Gulosibacter sp. TaxID=2817531 RepID=UPI003F900EBD
MTSKLRIPASIAAFAAATLMLAGCSMLGIGGDDPEADDRERADREESAETTDDDTTTTDDDEDTTTTDDEDDEEAFQEPDDADVFQLSVGDCITDTDMQGTELQTVPTVPCSQPHTYEVYHDFDIETDEFPGQGTSELDEIVADGCLGDAFEDFIGTPFSSSTLGVMYLSPTQGSWDNGDTLVSCMVYEGEGEGNVSTGSLKDSGL